MITLLLQLQRHLTEQPRQPPNPELAAQEEIAAIFPVENRQQLTLLEAKIDVNPDLKEKVVCT